MDNFRNFDRQTGFLLPPSVDEWLPEKHLARFVAEVIDGLDLRAMIGAIAAPVRPRMPEFDEDGLSDHQTFEATEVWLRDLVFLYEDDSLQVRYTYDFGDNWRHQIVLRRIPAAARVKYPQDIGIFRLLGSVARSQPRRTQSDAPMGRAEFRPRAIRSRSRQQGDPEGPEGSRRRLKVQARSGLMEPSSLQEAVVTMVGDPESYPRPRFSPKRTTSGTVERIMRDDAVNVHGGEHGQNSTRKTEPPP